MGDERSLRTREEIPAQDKWAVEDLFATDGQWEAEFSALEAAIPILPATYQGKLGASSGTLCACLREAYGLQLRLDRLFVYANEKLHENTANPAYQGLSSRAQRLAVSLGGALSFVEPEILSIPEETLAGFLTGDRSLSLYRRSIGEIRRNRTHILSAPLEQLLSASGELSGSPEDIFSAFTNADLKFPSIKNHEGNLVELTEARYVPFLKDRDRRVRKDAFDALFTTYDAYRNTLAATYSANVKKDIFYAKARKFSSTREASLFYGRIPLSVYDNLVQTVRRRLPLMHRYLALRKRVLQLPDLHMYDLYAPLVGDADQTVSFSQAKGLVLEGLKPLGEEYGSILQEAFQNRWIDVYENRGKRGGAYSWGAYGVHPYVLLNHKDDLNGAFTLAHEMGHALHTYYSAKHQPYPYAGYTLFVAEVASTCNESLLMQHMLQNAKDKTERLFLLNHFLEEFRGTVFRQTMFAEFEQKAHALAESGGALTPDVLSGLYRELNQTYFGDGVIIDPGIDIEWARIPHFYSSFYVYQYATGFSAAIALSRRILTEGPKAARDYLSFLKGGSSLDPIDLLKIAGVDMESPRPVEQALSLFEELLGQMEQIEQL
ncbi:MAG: oligoendopeptidase F [Oscillospiraceae bacterium]|nr:oligoendopeptidase F [Oscillospiraceae bacterium]